MADDDRGRIEELERRVGRLEVDLRAMSGLLTTGNERWRPPHPMPPPPTTGSRSSSDMLVRRSAPQASGPERRQSFDSRGEQALRWAGVVLVTLAVGFAVSTAISRGWIGPGLQLAGALGTSLALIGIGLRVRSTRAPWAHALSSGGLLALFSTAASPLFVDQLDEPVAFGSTAFFALGGYVLARHLPSPWVAGSSLIGSLSGWMVIAGSDVPFIASLVWVSVAVALAVILCVERPWFLLRVVAQATGAIAALGFAIGADSSLHEALVLVSAAGLLVAAARVPSLGRGLSRWHELEMQLVLLAPPWALLVSISALDLNDDSQIGLAAMAVTAGSVLVALAVLAKVRQTHFLSLLVGASVTLSVGLGSLLNPTTTLLALALQAVGLVLLARSFPDDMRLLLHAAGLGIIIVTGLTDKLLTAWATDGSLAEDAVRAATIVALVVGVGVSRRHSVHQVGAVTVLITILLWFGSVLVHLPQGQALVSLSWAFLGILVIVVGTKRGLAALGGLGLSVIALTMAKLLTVDLREVDALWRAALFFVIGLGIMRLGFLLPRLTDSARRRGNGEISGETSDDGPAGGAPHFDDLASAG